ncbi:hypothetical protein ACQKWADRAFT_209934 [Trichoderma austrokoningii]
MMYVLSESESNITVAPSQSQNRLLSIANNLTNVIKRGQGKIRERVQETHYDRAVFQLVVHNEGRGFDLEQIENMLLGLEISSENTDKRRKWTIWYFLSCFRMVREGAWEESWKTRKRNRFRKHKPFHGAKVANLIVNKIIDSDGLAAMRVYGALAECGYKLSKEAELSAKDIERVSDLVAENLCGQMHAPATSSLIPFPGVWLSIIFIPVRHWPPKVCRLNASIGA